MEIIGVVAIALLALACPLGMVGMAVVPWLIARARGKKKELSMSCMPMGEQSEQQQTSQQIEEGSLKEEVARLQREVETLKAQAPAAAGADIAPARASANGHKVPEEVPSSSKRGARLSKTQSFLTAATGPFQEGGQRHGCASADNAGKPGAGNRGE